MELRRDICLTALISAGVGDDSNVYQAGPEEFPDDFRCAHGALTVGSRVPLTLRLSVAPQGGQVGADSSRNDRSMLHGPCPHALVVCTLIAVLPATGGAQSTAAVPIIPELVIGITVDPIAGEGTTAGATTIRSGVKCLVPQDERDGAEVRLHSCDAPRARYTILDGSARTDGGRCLDWTNEGGPVHLAGCSREKQSQQWHFRPNGLIQNALRRDLCMDVEAGRTPEGTRVLAWRCEDLRTPAQNQKFRWDRQ